MPASASSVPHVVAAVVRSCVGQVACSIAEGMSENPGPRSTCTLYPS